MRYIFFASLLLCINVQAQWKDYTLTTKGDTVNKLSKNNIKEGKWIERIEDNMGEPGVQLEGHYANGEKVGKWNVFSLMGDPMGEENYNEGDKEGQQRYFDMHGNLIREENFKINNKKFDTVLVPDWNKDPTGNTFKKVVVKIDKRSLRHGAFSYFDEKSRMTSKEVYIMDRLEEQTTFLYDFYTGKLTVKDVQKYDIVTGKVIAVAKTDKRKTDAKPDAVKKFEQTKKGKKKRYQDGST